jgi:hypothetical protein
MQLWNQLPADALSQAILGKGLQAKRKFSGNHQEMQ